ncbi:hypothetical protein FGIG_03181 [Fasciola gigantica]|uniref:Fibronectin type-III domain-containing protein n=1 Tax=Fasciola gigantica TaxID=46835 RepID=A0A504YGR9_FASGI|nr:hypothetical protein FGIG_03181 [Fasciola gigantica]
MSLNHPFAAVSFSLRGIFTVVPNAPTITSVNRTPTGWYVTWTSENPIAVLANQVHLEDSNGRARLLTSYGTNNGASLTYTRPCTNYTVRVKLLSLTGWSSESAPYHFRTETIEVPPAPTNLRSTVTSAGRVLHWIPPNTTAHIRQYRIVGMRDKEIIEQNATYDSTQALLDSFHNWHNYSMVVYAENTCGSSGPSEELHVIEVSVPQTPHIVQVNDTPSTITIYFKAGGLNDVIHHYRVNYTGPAGSHQLDNIAEKAESVQLNEDIQSCFNYTIQLFAVNEVGASKPVVFHWVVRSTERPETPKLTSVVPADGSYVVHWKVVSNLNLTAHRLWYSSTRGVQGSIRIPGEATSAVLKFVKRCNSYTLQMLSENKCGYSDHSDPYTFDAVPLNAPRTPANVTASGTNQELILSWDAPPSSEYNEQYDIDLVGPQGFYRSYWAPPNAKNIVIRGLSTGALYQVAITTQNACGWSPFFQLPVQLNQDGKVVLGGGKALI